MSFIKKNYEKVLLGAVLLGLVGSLLLLPVIIAHDKQALSDIEGTIIHQTPRPLPALDLSMENDALSRVQSTYLLDFETTNRLFNPVTWKQTPDGRLIKLINGNEVGPGALVITKITPLYYMLTLDHIEPANQFSAARYVIDTQDEGADQMVQRRARQHFISVGEKDGALSLISANGPPDNPQLVLQLESGESVNLGLKTPYKQVDGYSADLTYPPEVKKWANQRLDDLLKFNGEDYKIVVIDPKEVVISAESNQKETTRPYQP